MKITCAHCGCDALRPAGWINRALARGSKVYCSRRCSYLGRRANRSTAEKREAKRLYDINYREKNRAAILAKKQAYHQRTYDAGEAAIKRRKRMPHHVAYCRRPEYRVAKAAYDRKRRAQIGYGEFWESFLLAAAIRTAALERMTAYEIRSANGALNKCEQRRRDLARTHGAKSEIGALGSLERGQRR